MHRLDGAGIFTLEHEGPTYLQQLRVPHLSVGTYSIPAGCDDPQQPHTEDEIYIVVSGRATLSTPTKEQNVGRGDVLFVPANEPHRFENVTEDLCVLVVFGPAEYVLAHQTVATAGSEQ